MEKIYVGKLTMTDTVSNADVAIKTELRFENGERRFEEPFKLRQEYYVVEKDELDAYMTRKEHLEQMNCTPVFGENQRLKAKIHELEAKIANLTEINKSLGEENSKLIMKQAALKVKVNKVYGMCSAGNELKAENERLKAENETLKKALCLFLQI